MHKYVSESLYPSCKGPRVSKGGIRTSPRMYRPRSRSGLRKRSIASQFPYPSQHDLPVEIDRAQNADTHCHHEPNFFRHACKESDHSPHGLPQAADDHCPERLGRVCPNDHVFDNAFDPVKLFGRGIDCGFHFSQTMIQRLGLRRWRIISGI